MSSTVKNLTVTCNPPKDSDAFTVGDWVTGVVNLEVVKECHIESLSIKFKGKAEVLWTERHGNTTHVYHSKDKYFSIKHFFVRHHNSEEHGDNEILLSNQNGETYSSIVNPGCHVYPFTFQFPVMDMPRSFKGSVGKIVYLLEAKLSRSMRIPKKDKTKISYVPRADFSCIPELMIPQHESKDKKMKFFSSGTVAMDVDIEKSGFFQGEGIKVIAHIQNNSSREIKPKFCVYSKHSFFAEGRRRLNTKDLVKEVGEPIPPSAKTMVTRIITIPHDMEPSILDCKILKVEHRLRVYLDVKYASDPEIKFPIVILPVTQVPGEAPPPPAAAAASAAGLQSRSLNTPYWNPQPTSWGIAQPSAPAVSQPNDPPPPPYEAYGMYPSLMDFNN
ncbi:arrestin domain-containing protein 3-like isoform X2 [Cynoglossus semilaevis]|uniref:arrestin domain-containing protein 3-like isoform X2 n=1 Tax=Cynoglossus semilaevis TaxID=244447 RepID=UPI000497F31E|nr:arrestin domain-containing protein 3-like isoform X2 [Cynoglossus semilaevis]